MSAVIFCVRKRSILERTACVATVGEKGSKEGEGKRTFGSQGCGFESRGYNDLTIPHLQWSLLINFDG